MAEWPSYISHTQRYTFFKLTFVVKLAQEKAFLRKSTNGPYDIWLANNTSSVAINYLIERSKHTKDTVTYAYFKGEETNTQYLPTQIISSLVKQLCRGLTVLPEPALEFYKNFQMNGRRPLFNDLEDLFMKCLKHFERVFIVLDGLDECEQKHRKTILNFVLDLGAQNEAVKILVVSRRLMDILHTFQRHKHLHVNSKNDLAQKDIAKLVKYRVTTELSHINPEVQETVIQTLIEKSNGMWVLVPQIKI